MEQKKYKIGQNEYMVNHDIKLKNKQRLNELMVKIPTADNRTAPGLSFDETMELLALITIPVNINLTAEQITKDFEDMPESIELEIIADFFYTRARLMLSGMNSFISSRQNGSAQRME